MLWQFCDAFSNKKVKTNTSGFLLQEQVTFLTKMTWYFSPITDNFYLKEFKNSNMPAL